jgi:hypothetical protein
MGPGDSRRGAHHAPGRISQHSEFMPLLPQSIALAKPERVVRDTEPGSLAAG